MKKYCFSNSKGGVSKSTLNCECAFYFSSIGKKVILIDGDPQGNATENFNIKDFQYELFDVLTEKCFIEDSIIKVTFSFTPIKIMQKHT